MARLIEITGNTFLNPSMIVLIAPESSKCVVTLVTGKTITVPMTAEALAKKCAG